MCKDVQVFTESFFSMVDIMFFPCGLSGIKYGSSFSFSRDIRIVSFHSSDTCFHTSHSSLGNLLKLAVER